jgi:precorrin-6B methylase 1
MKRGSLVCVGSGIKSIGHLSLEAQGWITQADLVVYCVADPATEIWIQRHARAHFDLYRLYDNDKRRIHTYEEMVDMMVNNARDGKDVCAVFYGHPGVFVLPTHKAIETLRAEDIPAAMLPAVSALDCLFADLGIDPAHRGCQTVEATDMLLRRRSLMTDGHVVIWQIGCVGDLRFRFAGYDNRNLGVLIEYLREFYEPTQEVVHYQASQFPVCQPVVERVSLEGLLEARVTGLSTLYVPPAVERPTMPDMAAKLGLRLKGMPVAPRPDGNGHGGKPLPWKRDVPLKPYTASKERSGLADYLADLSRSPRMLAEFDRDPERASRLYADMTDDERAALVSRHPGRIRVALKAPEHPELEDLDRVHGPACAGSSS